MIKNILSKSALSLFVLALLIQNGEGKGTGKYAYHTKIEARDSIVAKADTTPPADVMEIVRTVIYSLNTFNIDAVADLYTPNAVIADDEPPYSWNGPTAGVQWVNAVEKVCKDNKLTKLKGTIETINVYQHSADNVYIVVPVNYTGDLPGKENFTAEGGFAFVLRKVDGKWLVKSQVWMPRKAMQQ